MIMIKKGGDDTVVVGETWCSETERMLSENDDSECEYHCRQIKSAALELDTLQSVIISKSLNLK